MTTWQFKFANSDVHINFVACTYLMAKKLFFYWPLELYISFSFSFFLYLCNTMGSPPEAYVLSEWVVVNSQSHSRAKKNEYSNKNALNLIMANQHRKEHVETVLWAKHNVCLDTRLTPNVLFMWIFNFMKSYTLLATDRFRKV